MAEATVDLSVRAGLPEHLRLLALRYPRDGWEGHGNFSDLTRFWLDRHLMFRDLLARLQAENQSFVDGSMAAEQFASRAARLTGLLLSQLQGHHRIEDTHYFPRLLALDARLAPGFDLLDADHQLLDKHIHGLAEASNRMLGELGAGAAPVAAEPVRDRLVAFAGFLDRHLCDEEELVVPLILEYGAPDED